MCVCVCVCLCVCPVVTLHTLLLTVSHLFSGILLFVPVFCITYNLQTNHRWPLEYLCAALLFTATFSFLTACPLTPPFCLLCPPHCYLPLRLLQLCLSLSCFLFLPFPVLPSLHVSLLLHRFCLCRASVFDGRCYREPWKLLQPLTQLQCVQHRPGHQRSYYHAAVRRVLRSQDWRRAHPMSVGGHQLRRGAAHTNVHSHWPGGEDGGTCDHWPQW